MGIFMMSVLWGWVVYLATRSPARVRQAVAGVMAGPVCGMILLDVRVSGMEHLVQGPCILVSNHQGHVDEAVIANVYRHLDHPVILAKMHHVWSLGFFKRLFEITGNILVGPDSLVDGVRVLRTAREALTRGAQVLIYPEGTRRPDGRLGPFKLGAFLLAVEAGVPVVPIAISRFAPEFDPRRRHLEPHIARVRVLEPVATKGLARADIGMLRDEVRDRIRRILDDDEAGSVRGVGPAQGLP
jgi:1-acyl-sn-glycerol-3-phosphate acyltransferase